MKRFIIVVALIAILATMYGYLLGRGVSNLLLKSPASLVSNLPNIDFGVSSWDKVVLWTGPILVLLLIWPAAKFVIDLYFRKQRDALQQRALAQMDAFMKTVSPLIRTESDGEESSPKSTG